MIVVSPGVLSREFDFAMFVPSLAATICGLVITATKGPVNELTTVTSANQFAEIFGDSSANHIGVISAQMILQRCRIVKVVRVQAAGSPAVASTYTFVDTAGSPAATLKVDAKTPGTWGDNLTIKISAGTAALSKKLQVLYKNRVVETWDNLVKTAGAFEYETVINNANTGSQYIVVDSLDSSSLQPAETSHALAAGGDGLAGIADSDYIGVNSTTVTGLQLFGDADSVDVNLIAIPGVTTSAVHAAVITLTESRGDVLGVLDPPKGLTPQAAADLKNAAGTYSSRTALNSNRVVMNFGWIKVRDSNLNLDVWVPPSVPFIKACATTDIVSEPWFAPAGLTRGRVTDALDIERTLTKGDRDILYSNGINPIAKFVGDGIVVWGNKTTTTVNADLQSVNIVRGLMYLEKVIASATRYLVFEPNNPKTWRRFSGMVDPVLRDIISRQGLYDARVVCDNTTNTPTTIDRREMHGKVYLKWTKAAEVIVIDFTMIPTGASFQEYFSGSASL